MGSMLPYIAYMDPMGIYIYIYYSLYVGLSFTGKMYYFCGSNGATFKPKIRDSQILIRD